MAKISVLLPFYNPGSFFKEALESIIRQSFKDWELILVNNASDLASIKTAHHFALRDKRIKLVSENEKGIVAALNTGILHCEANYIARMDADDISLPRRLELQYHFMEQNPHVDLCSGKVIHSSPHAQKTKGYALYVEWINSIVSCDQFRLYRFIESPLAHPSVMFRRSCVEKWGAYRQGDFPEDYELWLRWMQQGACMAKTPEVLLEWRDHPVRLSRSDARYHPDAFCAIRLQYLHQWLKENNPFHPDIAIWGAGKTSRRQSRILEKMGCRILYYIDVDLAKTQAHDCIHYSETPTPGNCFIISLTGSRGAFAKIEAFLESKEYTNGKDFILAAGF